MYEAGYNKMFWGLIFTIVNINFGPIDILPNFIGYLLMLSGLNMLEKQHQIYRKGKLPAIILSILSLKDFFTVNQNNMLAGNIASGGLWLMMISSLISLISIYLIYITCSGIYLISTERGLQDLGDNAKGNFKFYFIISSLLVFLVPFSLNLPRNGGAYVSIFFILIIINLFAVIGIAMLFRRSRELLKDQT